MIEWLHLHYMVANLSVLRMNVLIVVVVVVVMSATIYVF